MWYVIIGRDRPDSLPLRQANREAHLARLHQLRDEARLLVAGPMPRADSPEPGPDGFSGSVIIAEFPCLEDARAWAEDDPYLAAGVYESVEVQPFKAVLP